MNKYASTKRLAAIACLALSGVVTAPIFAAGDGPTGGAVGSEIPDQDRLGATDVYLLSCPPGTRSARAGVNEGNNPDAPLSVQIIDPHGKASTENAVAGGVSPQARLRAGPGAYLALVHKNGPGTQGYTITVDCYDADGERIPGDQATLVQDQ